MALHTTWIERSEPVEVKTGYFIGDADHMGPRLHVSQDKDGFHAHGHIDAYGLFLGTEKPTTLDEAKQIAIRGMRDKAAEAVKFFDSLIKAEAR